MKPLIFILVLLAAKYSRAQTWDIRLPDTTETSKKYITIPAGAQYAASPWKKLWWGEHWRKEWVQPVTFPVFDLATTAGGLRPIKEGGGHETKTLRLRNPEGREYVLRTVNKNLDILLPDEYKGTFINDLVNDQISTAHPYGPLVVAQLSNAIGILHTNPSMVYVPDDPLLGSFRATFANHLCLFEERPSGTGWEHDHLTGHADVVINSEKLFAKLTEDPQSSVDQIAFLKARLLDMVINDWDRHEDQWIWAGKKTKNKLIFTAFARDRDQSFSKTDGINMFLLSRPWALRSLQDLDPKLRDIIGSNLSATSLDRQFLNKLTREDWRKTIEQLQEALTEKAIRNAVDALPPPIYKISGRFLYERILARTRSMMDYALRYYDVLAKEVTVKATDYPENFVIRDQGKNKISITITLISDGAVTDDTLFHRVFSYPQSKTINLYAMDGKDIFKDERKQRSQIAIRSFGNGGNDQFIEGNGIQTQKLFAYDTKDDKPKWKTNFRFRIRDTSVTNFKPRAFKYDWWMPFMIPGYNPDDGLIIGAGITIKKMGWNKDPYRWHQTLRVNYATATKAWNIRYEGVFTALLGKWDFDFKGEYRQPAYFLNYYGFGNNTTLRNNSQSFFRVKASSILIDPGISRTWNKNFLKGDAFFNMVKIHRDDVKFIGKPKAVDTTVFKQKYFGGAGIAYAHHTEDNARYPTNGSIWQAKSAYTFNLKDPKQNFLHVEASYTFYISLLKRLTFAHRIGAATNTQGYEFYQANSIGGDHYLRGYWRTRFTGKTSLYQNTDLRWKITDLKGYVLRGTLGMYAFFDAGRVWQPGEHSRQLHTGYGGGLYLLPFNKIAINIFYSSSTESNLLTIRTGFMF